MKKQNVSPAIIASNLVIYYIPTDKNLSLGKIELKWVIITIINNGKVSI